MTALVGVVLVAEGGSETGVYEVPTFGWQCARCQEGSPAATYFQPEQARTALEEHDCVDDACPECPTGVVESVGRMESDTGHQPYACNAGCGYRG
ncbi:MAG: hypothetical protein JWP11_3715 [Frankiales bacterium]|nr:hypothetical protein [Frankiales bacterium]